jgi:hypothetical protein
MPLPFSPAGQALGLAGMIPGMGGMGDATESPEERRKRLAQIEQQRSALTQQGSPAANSLFGGGLSGIAGTGRLF